MSKFKWEDVGEREYFELTTEAMQYHWREDARYLASAGGVAGSSQNPWLSEIKVNGKWIFVGAFRTGREAKAAAIAKYGETS